MKQSQNINDSWLRIVFLVVRILLITTFSFTTLLLSYMVFGLFDVASIPSLLFCCIVLFPFNQLRSLFHLQIYFRILLLSTAASIVINLILMFTQLEYGYLSMVFELGMLVANVYIVYRYIQYKINPALGNPIYEKYRLIIISVTLVGAICLLLLQLVLPFIHIRRTPDGQEFFSLPNAPGYIETLFTDEALDSHYELASRHMSDPQMKCVLISRKYPQADSVTLTSQNQKVLHVEYTDVEPTRIDLFNDDGSSVPIVLTPELREERQIYYTDESGMFQKIDWRDDYTKFKNTAIELITLPSDLPSSYIDNEQFFAGDTFVIQLCEYFEVPDFTESQGWRQNKHYLPWSLVIKDNSGEIELIKENYAKY